ncbi:hypothetical protein ACKE5C_02000 [Aneurinibacillus thermoaerophilus]|uniref:Uncharacterized protein n=1 Tax=Aneurinibacillus thermoaerophilus TaxID=143495 RepID=A0ABX8YDD6_ANETH|nr:MULTISPECIES: hypothetical protein [Aneurinibacillus]AMA74313.1 hypothetical protein ACH33_16850 [Aneurinibacillus sp. XH2]QYY43104.1 hypothetical protein K3F53_01980 [Aneurinibacillus thermoaerophilus]
MKFEVYDLIGPTSEFLATNKEKLLQHIKDSRTFTDDKGLKYCLNNIDYEDNIIGGTISQEYFGDLKTVENKVEKPIKSNPWEKTYFFIDIATSKLLLQRRRYSPKNLNHSKTEQRIIEIIHHDVFLKHFGSSFNMIKTSVGFNNDFFKEIIKKEKIQQLDVTNLRGKKVVVGTPLHNPREDWDKVLAESWNTYDSNYVDEIVLRSENEDGLSKSVFQKLVLAAGGDVKAVRYYDEEEEKVITVSHKSVGSLDVDVKKDEETVTVLQKAFNKIKSSRDALRRFRRK